MKQPYFVVSQQHRFSKFGTPMVQINLLGIKDRKEYITYVDEPNNNYRNWTHIINSPEAGFVLNNLNIKTHKDKELINADSKPRIEWQTDTPAEIIEQIQALWAEEDRRNGESNFWNLFE
jgi:hypothetical protein